MVEENFKIGVEIEVQQSSLEDVSKQVQRKIKEAFEKGTREGLKGSALSGGAASLKSAKQSVSVSGADFAKQIEKALAPQVSSFEKASKEVTAAVSKLVQALQSTGSPATEEAAPKGRRTKTKSAELVKAEEKLITSIEDEAAARKEAAAAARKAARQTTPGPAASSVSAAPSAAPVLAPKQTGVSNTNRKKEIDLSRTFGNSNLSSGGVATDVKHKVTPGSERVREAKADSKTDTSGYERAAQRAAEGTNKVLQELKQAIIAAIPKASADPEFFKRVGLEGKASVGEGTAPVITGIGKQTRHLEGQLVIAGNKIERFSTVVAENIRTILNTSEGKERISAIGRLSRRDPERAELDLRRLSKEIFQSAAPVADRQPLRGFQKGGESQLVFKLSPEQSKRLSELKDEAQIIAEVNRELATAGSNLSQFRDQLKSLGLDLVTSLGLGDAPASDISIQRAGEDKSGPIESLQMKVMTRNIAGLGLGGSGAMRPARSFQVQQLHEIEGGGVPSVMGPGERRLQESGLHKPGAFKEVTAALLDPGMFPDVFEDQIVFDPKIFQAPIREVKHMVVRNLAEGIQEGSELAAGQLVGTKGEGAEEVPVKFELKGAEAKVKSIEKVVIGGIEGVKVVYEELNDTITGMKLTERSGLKGIAKAVPDFGEKYGLGSDVGVGISTRALGARGAIRPVIEMVSNNIADVTGRGAQEIADAIVQAMDEGGQELYTALLNVSKQFGLESIPGVREITEGPLAKAAGGKAKVLTGRIAMGRLPEEGMKGAMPIKDRFLSGPDIQSLGLRAENIKMVADMQAKMVEASEGFYDLQRGLSTLVGETEVAREGLRKVLPDEFKRLPAEAAKSTADLKGTILDPDYVSALAVSLPTAEGGERLLRMPAIGEGLGQRDFFKNELGGIEVGTVSHLFDQILEQAEKARAALGLVPLTEESEAFQEAAEVSSKAIRNQIAEIKKLGFNTEEGAAAAQDFVNKFRLVIESLGEGPAGISYVDRRGQEQQIKRSASDYLSFLDERKTKPRGLEQQVFAVGDLLAERAAGGGKVPGLGAVHKDASVLNKTMEILGITLDANGEAAQKAIGRLEQLEDKLLDLLGTQALSAGKPTSASKVSPAKAREGGLGRGPMGTVVGFPTDASKELEQATVRLQQLAAAGANVDEALAAVERMEALGEIQGGIAKDAVLINKTDWENLIQDTMKTRGIGREEAEKRLQQPVMTMRYPITGPRSFTPAKLQPVGDEVLPKGKLGVAAPAPVSSAQDLSTILGAFDTAIQATIARLDELGGVGPEALVLREQLRALIDESQALIPVFKHTGQNLDIDGDKLAVFANTVDSAGAGIQTFTEELAQGKVGLRGIYASVIGKQVSKGGMGDVEDFSKFFGQVVKGRPEGLRKAVLRPEDPEMFGSESFAHVASKKSVGLATDMFNRMLLAVTAGTSEIGDAMETGIGAIMLGVNEALAQKHGQGGTRSTGQFLSDFGKGNLGSIKQGLEGNEGFLGKLGGINKQVKEELRKRLYVMGAGLEEGGAEALKEFASQQGLDVSKIIPKDITSANFSSVIEKIVEELDLFQVITRMFTRMKENAVKALKAQGASDQEIDAAMTDMKKKGIDQKLIVDTFFPGFGATRHGEREIIGKTPAESKAKRALALMPKTFAESGAEDAKQKIEPTLDNFWDHFTEEFSGNAQESARVILQTVDAWWSSVRDSVEILSVKDISQGLPEGSRVRGRFARGTETLKGEEGKIKVAADIATEFAEARRALAELAAGTGELDPQRIIAAGQAFRTLMGIVGHEGIHKAGKGLASVVGRVVSSFESARGVLGKNREQIESALSQRGGIRAVRSKIEELQTQKAAGATEGGGLFRKEVDGKFKDVVETTDIDSAITSWVNQLNLAIAEELLAYRFQGKLDPSYLENSPLAQLPQEVLDFLDHKLDMLAQSRPEILETTSKAAGALTSAVFEGLLEGVRGTGPEVARADATSRIEALSSRDFPGAEVVGSTRSLLGAHEKVIEEGSSAFKLRGIERKEGRLSYGQPSQKLPFEEKLGPLADEISEIQNSLAEGLPDPDTLRDFSRRIRKAAQGVRSKLTQLSKTGEVAGTNPQEEYMRVMREFRAGVATQMVNESRNLEDQIAQAIKSGETDTPEFRDLVQKFQNSVLSLHEWASSTLQVEGRGKGAIATYFASGQGELLESAKGAGIAPTSDTFAAVFQNVAGEGDEAANFMSRMEGPIGQVIKSLQEGVEPLTAWNRLFSSLMEYPDEMTTDLVKVVEIFSKFSRLLGFTEGQFSELTTGLGTVTDRAKRMRDELKKGRRPEDITNIAASGSKQSREALAQGFGSGLAESVEAQYNNVEKIVEQRRRKLEEIIKLPAYKNLEAAGKKFEPTQVSIVDPSTGEVIQKLTVAYERFGNTVKTQMSQAGAATQGFGKQMTSALRRVVQWGMASGIIYGMVRAFRTLISTVTNVQSKIAALQKVMDTSVTNFEALQEGAVSMATSFGISIDQVLDGMVVYGQQGLKMNEIMDRTRSTLLAVNTTTLTSAKATEAITSAMKVFSAELSSSEQAVDAWGAVAANHAITAENLAVAMQRTGAAAETAGISFNDFLGIVTAIGSVTRQTGQEVSTGIKFMLQSMRKASSQKFLLQLDIPTQDASGDLRPTMDVLSQLAGQWENLTRKQQVNAAQTLAGTRHYNQFLVLMNNWQEVLEASTDAQNSQGFAARKNAIAMQTFHKQVESLKQSLSGFALDLGKAFIGPVTLGVSALRKVISALELLPDSVKAGTVAMLGLGVAFQKVGHLAINTLDFMAGGDIAKKLRELGAVGSIASGIKSVAGAFKGMGAAIRMPLELAEDAATMELFADATGIASKAVFKLRTAFAALAAMSSLTLVSMGALVVVLGVLAAVWATLPKRGADVASELEDQIGKAMAAAEQYQNMGGQIRKLEHMYSKVIATMGKMDAESISESLRNQDFQGAATAVHEYQTALSEASNAMGSFDTGMITGVDDYGNLVVGIGDAFKYSAAASADFKKAQTAALQTKVIKAYAAEISEAMTVWDTIKSGVASFASVLGKTVRLGPVEMDTSLQDKYNSATKELETLLEKRKELSEAGKSTLGVEAQIGGVLERQSKLRGELLEKALEIKKVLEEMPIFESLDVAMDTLGPELARSIEAALPSGAFGKGATTGSVLMQKLSRSAGIGGMFDSSTLASPSRAMDAFMQKGITPQVSSDLFSSVKSTGDIVQISPEAASKLLQTTGGFSDDDKVFTEAARTAMTGIAKVDEATGESLIVFYNNLTKDYITLNEDMWGTLRGSLSREGQLTGVYAKKAVEEFMRSTRKILSLQFTGATAGIRKPGDVDIGPSRFLEVGAKDRMMDLLPDQVQRMMEIQNEIGNYVKTINEGMSGEGLENTSQQIDSLSGSLLNMIVDLQQEGFKLSVVAHYTQALQDLQLTMEQSIDTSKKAEARERARMEVERHTSGALSGQSVLKDLQFGPTSRELTATQRLQKRLGSPFESMITDVTIGEERLAQGSNLRQDIAEKQVDFKAMIQDLKSRGESLTKEQMERLVQQQQQGISKEQAAFVNAIHDTSTELKDIQSEQLGVQAKILEVVTTMGKAMSEDPAEQKAQLKEFFQEETGQMPLDSLKKLTDKLVAAKAIEQDYLPDLRRQILGVQKAGTFSRTELSTPLSIGTSAAGATKFERGTGTLSGILPKLPEDVQTKVSAGVDRIVDLENKISQMGQAMAQGGLSGKVNRLMMSEKVESLEKAVEKEFAKLLAVDEISQLFQKNLRGKLATLAPNVQNLGQVLEGGGDDLQNLVGLLESQGLRGFAEAGKGVSNAFLDGQHALSKAKKHLQSMVAIESFAKGIEDMIVDFQKQAALTYEKVGSDIEGPFARVGQPGFRNQFENRRREIQGDSIHPRSLEQIRERDRALAQVDFDEQEARIKEKQDIEVGALKQQQGQAEQVRSFIADQLFSGALGGAPETEAMAKSFMDTLTEQLATSEQADMRGGELLFKGIPALEDISSFAQKLKAQADEKQKEARVSEFKEGMSGVEDKLLTQIDVLKQILKAATGGSDQTGDLGAVASSEGSIAATSAAGRSAPFVGIRSGPLEPGVLSAGVIARATMGMGGPESRFPTGLSSANQITQGGMNAENLQAKLNSGSAVVKVSPAELRPSSVSTGTARVSPDQLGINTPPGNLPIPTVSAVRQQASQIATTNIPKTGPLSFTNEDLKRYRAGPTVPVTATVPQGITSSRTVAQPVVPQPAATVAPRNRSTSTSGIQVFGPSSGQFAEGLDPTGKLNKDFVGPPERVDKRPTVSFSNADLAAYRSPVNYQVGRTNHNLATENEVDRFGDANATPGNLVVGGGGSTGTPNAETLAGRQPTPGAGNAQVEALQSLIDKFDSLQSVLEALVAGGLQLPSGFTEAITGLGGTFEEALGNTLSVSVENTPLAVEIPDLESALSSAFDSSGLGSVGSEVADTRLRLQVLESVIDPDGPSVEDRITSATDSLRINLNETSLALTDLETKVTDLEETVTPLEGLGDLGPQITDIESSITELSSTVESNTGSIETLQLELEQLLSSAAELESTVSDFGERLDTAEDLVAEGRQSIEDFGDLLETIREQAATATASSEESVEAVEELRASLLTLQTTIEAQKQNLEGQIRQSVDTASRLGTRVGGIEASINQIRGKSESALSAAQQALNRSRNG